MNRLPSAFIERRSPAVRRPGDVRGPFERDRARIIHSAGFRRLQAKTQVLDVGRGDFYRTRLTHSMEVAQIGRGLLEQLCRRAKAEKVHLPPADLVEAICLAHDLGHPPFGHDGETALNFCLVRDAKRRHEPVTDGFEANGQTLRLVSRLEAHTPGFGLNLTRRTLLGVLKYPRCFAASARLEWPSDDKPIDLRPFQPPKCYHGTEADVVDWILAPFGLETRAYFAAFDPATPSEHAPPGPMPLDASLLEVADDIAYGTHDLEDGLELGLVGRDALEEVDQMCRTAWGRRMRLTSAVTQLSDPNGRKDAIGALVNALVTAADVRWPVEAKPPEIFGQVTLEPEARTLLESLKRVVERDVIGSAGVRMVRFRAIGMLAQLFDALASDPERLLPRTLRSELETQTASRVIVDHLASLTDRSAVTLYMDLYSPGGAAGARIP